MRVVAVSVVVMLMLPVCSALAGSGDRGNGVCGGRPLPASRSRLWSNHILRCSSGSSAYLREPVFMPKQDQDEWVKLNRRARRNGDVETRLQMQAIARKMPIPSWSGEVAYDTYEHWDWVEWYYGPDEVACGSHIEKDCWQDSENKEHCTDRKVIHSCFHDVDRSESRFCSTEAMSYSARYIRPPSSAWGPTVSNPPYYDELGNGFDLLPGESEIINVYNSSGVLKIFNNGTQMSPVAEVADAWYKYEINIAPQRLDCVYKANHHINVTVEPHGRIKKRTPNPFRHPVNRFGKEIESIEWTIDHGTPVRILMSDASAEVIASMSRNSYAFGKEQKTVTAELERSRKINGTAQETLAAAVRDSFQQDTHFRLRLFRGRPWARDIRTNANFYGRGAEYARGAFAEHYSVELSEFWNSSGPWSDSLWKWLTVRVIPGENYRFQVSMWQKNVPFYYQPEDFFNKMGEGWYSNELPIEFSIPKDAPDFRDGTQKLVDYYNGSPTHRNPVTHFQAWWGAVWGLFQ